jgi:hypothetical protein
MDFAVHIKEGHQDQTMLWHKLDLRAKINVLADDKQADDSIYRKPPRLTGLFPHGSLAPVLPYFMANDKLPSKGSISAYILGMQLTCQQ